MLSKDKPLPCSGYGGNLPLNLVVGGQRTSSDSTRFGFRGNSIKSVYCVYLPGVTSCSLFSFVLSFVLIINMLVPNTELAINSVLCCSTTAGSFDQVVNGERPLKPGMRLRIKGENLYFPPCRVASRFSSSPVVLDTKPTRVVLRQVSNDGGRQVCKEFELHVVQNGASSKQMEALVPQQGVPLLPGSLFLEVRISSHVSEPYMCVLAAPAVNGERARHSGQRNATGSMQNTTAGSRKRGAELMQKLRDNRGNVHARRHR